MNTTPNAEQVAIAGGSWAQILAAAVIEAERLYPLAHETVEVADVSSPEAGTVRPMRGGK